MSYSRHFLVINLLNICIINLIYKLQIKEKNQNNILSFIVNVSFCVIQEVICKYLRLYFKYIFIFFCFIDGYNSYMKIPANELFENMKYKIRVYAATPNGDREGHLVTMFLTSISPTGGVCVSDIPAGQPFTLYNIICY